jgi:hypothetical protein
MFNSIRLLIWSRQRKRNLTEDHIISPISETEMIVLEMSQSRLVYKL